MDRVGDDRRLCGKAHFRSKFRAASSGTEFGKVHTRTDHLDFFGGNAILPNELRLDHLSIGHNLGAAVLIDEGPALVSERVGDAAGARDRHSKKMKRQAKPVVLRTVGLDQVNLVTTTETPDAEGSYRINTLSERERQNARPELLRFWENLTPGIAD